MNACFFVSGSVLPDQHSPSSTSTHPRRLNYSQSSASASLGYELADTSSSSPLVTHEARRPLEDDAASVESHEFDKYLKYSTTVLHQHEAGVDQLQHPHNQSTTHLLDSNHNYQQHLQQYGGYQHSYSPLTDAQNNQQLLLNNTIKSELILNQHQHPYIVTGLDEHYNHEQHQTTMQHQPQHQQQVKSEEDFSVILADVRKTCYSS